MIKPERITPYEVCVKEIAIYVREELQQIEELHRLDLLINISGRLHEGEIKITFGLGVSYDAGGRVEGGNLEQVLVEYMRRFGWDKRNKPLELSFAGPDPVDAPVNDEGMPL